MKNEEYQPLIYLFQENDRKDKKVFSQIFPDLSRNNKSCKDAYINYNGLRIYTTFMINFVNDCKIHIKLIKARQDIPQGITVSVHNAKLKFPEANQETKNCFVFFYDYSRGKSTLKGGPIELSCIPIKFRSVEKQKQKKWLMIHNIWETKRSDGRMESDSWGGNYGVVIEQREKDIYRLHFSCGKTEHPNVTFEDLVIDVSIEGEYTTRFQCSEF